MLEATDLKVATVILELSKNIKNEKRKPKLTPITNLIEILLIQSMDNN